MKWPFDRLMEKPPGDGGDPGSGADPPKDPPADPPKGGDPPKDPPPPATISVDVLPAELRDRPEAEQKFLLEHMVTGLASRNTEVEALKLQLAELTGTVNANKAPPEPDPHEGKTMEELMLEDSDAALDRYMEKRGYVKAFTGLESRVDSAEYSMVAADIDDFEEHREAVDLLLKEGKLAPTRANVRGAYTMVIGAEALKAKELVRREAGNTLPPSSPPPPEGDDVEAVFVSSLEEEIATSHGMSAKEWKESQADVPMKLKLPT